MSRTRKGLAATAVLAAASVSLAACGGSSSTGGGGGNAASGPPNSQSTQSVSTTAKQGGTLDYLVYKGPEHLDPQRVYIGSDIANLGRTVYRGLVAFPASPDAAVANKPVPDLATDTGTSTDGAKTWSFTLKDGVKWQDGKEITCADLKYGISRTFATDVITGGPNYALSYLDIPTDAKTGLPTYTGPYKSSAAGIADFNKAVTCSGKTITYHFKKPFPDFPLAIASLPAFGPYRQDQDKGDASNFSIFSDGPYKLQGTVNPNKGYTLVRNPEWSKSTDTIRQANPDEIKFTIGADPDAQYDQLIKDTDPDAITISSVPSSDYSQISGSVADRAVHIDSPFSTYILPDFASKTMQNPMVRQALAMATSRTGWINGLGGPNAAKEASSVVNPAVPGYAANPAFANIPSAGDPAAAKKLLEASGLPMPVAIKFTYPGGTPESDGAAAALKQGWDAAGFNTTLNSLPNTYYSVVQSPDFKSDVVYGGWGADWPSIGTVLPPLFDSRPNLTPSSTGQDYGQYKSAAANKLIDQAAASTTLDAANKIYTALDEQLGKDVAYIPLNLSEFFFLHGSNVGNYVNSVSTSGYPDLGVIALDDPTK